MSTSNKYIIWDILTGIVASIIILYFLFSFTGSFKDALLLFSPTFLIVGYLRGKNPDEPIIIKVILLNLLMFSTTIMALLSGLIFLLFPLVSVVATYVGIKIRRLNSLLEKKSIIYFSSFALSIAILTMFVVPAYFSETLWTTKNTRAPEFSLTTYEGKKINSADYNGKIVILDFWATWCGPCKKQFPELEKFYKDIKDNDEIVLFVATFESKQNPPEKIEEYIVNTEYDLPFVNDSGRVAYDKFEIKSIPKTIIIGKKGNIRYVHTGYESSENFYSEITDKVEELLKE